MFFKKKKIIDKPISSNHNGSRRDFVGQVGWGLVGVPFLMVGNGVMRTAYNSKVYKVDILIDKLPQALDGLKILQLSDIHTGSFYSVEPVRKAREVANALDPDLVMMTGDFVNFSSKEIIEFLPELASFKSKYGVFGCLGNHDHYMSDENLSKLMNGLKDTGMDLLMNENRVLNIRGAKLNLAGVDNTGMKQTFADFNKALYGLSADNPTILLCHDPTNWDKSIRNKHDVDLMLSGHTHGGQIGISIFGKKYTPAGMVYKQWAGLYNDGMQYLYVNRGLGMTGLPIRMNINPEISLITLRSSFAAK